MQPYYQDEWVTLYHGDALEILPSIRPGDADVVLTDPPGRIMWSRVSLALKTPGSFLEELPSISHGSVTVSLLCSAVIRTLDS